MSKFSDKFIDGMSLVAEKVDENRFLGAIKDSFTIYRAGAPLHRPAGLHPSELCGGERHQPRPSAGGC